METQMTRCLGVTRSSQLDLEQRYIRLLTMVPVKQNAWGLVYACLST